MNSIIRVHVCGVFVCEKQVATFRTEKIKPSPKNCSSSKSHLMMAPKANPTVSMFKTKFYNRSSSITWRFDGLKDWLVFSFGSHFDFNIFVVPVFSFAFHLSCFLSKCFCFHLPALSW